MSTRRRWRFTASLVLGGFTPCGQRELRLRGLLVLLRDAWLVCSPVRSALWFGKDVPCMRARRVGSSWSDAVGSCGFEEVFPCVFIDDDEGSDVTRETRATLEGRRDTPDDGAADTGGGKPLHECLQGIDDFPKLRPLPVTRVNGVGFRPGLRVAAAARPTGDSPCRALGVRGLNAHRQWRTASSTDASSPGPPLSHS